jgi:hypothetical protein
MRGSSPAPRGPWLPRPRALVSKSQADETAFGGFLVVGGLCSGGVPLSMLWHGSSEMEGRKGSAALPQPDESAGAAPSNGRSPRLPPLGLEPERSLAPQDELLGVFIYIYFSKSFFTEIYFQFHNLQFCTPTVRLRGGRPPTALLPGGRDLNVNKICFNRILAPGGGRRPAAGRQVPAARWRRGRPCSRPAGPSFQVKP